MGPYKQPSKFKDEINSQGLHTEINAMEPSIFSTADNYSTDILKLSGHS